MDANQAAEELKTARRASEAGASPRLSPRAAVAVGILVAAAITLVGWGSVGVGWRVAELAAGILVAGAAVLVVREARRRQGVRGLRGLARQEWTGCLVSGLAFFVVALNATSQLRLVYAGLGVVGGAAMGLVLYRRGSCS